MDTIDGKAATLEGSLEWTLLGSYRYPDVPAQIEVGFKGNGLALEVFTLVDHRGKLSEVFFVVDVEVGFSVVVFTPTRILVVGIVPAAALSHSSSRKQKEQDCN